MGDPERPATRATPPPVASLVTVAALLVAVGIDLSPLGAHDDQRLAQVGALVLVLTLVAVSPRRLAASTAVLLDAPRASAALGIALLLGLVSAALAADPWTALLELALLTAIALQVTAVAAELRWRPSEATRILLVGAGLAAALVLLPLLGRPALSPRPDALWQRAGFGSGFTNPRFLNQFQAGVLPLLALLGRVRPHGLAPPLVGLMIAVTSWSLSLTEGRGAAVAVTAAIATVAIAHGPVGRRFARDLGLPAGVGLVAALLTRPLLGLEGLLVTGDITSASGRIELWRSAAATAGGHPLLGIGPGHLAHTSQGLVGSAHPHDLPLQLAAEWGLLAALVLTVPAVTALVRLLRPASAPPGAPAAGALDADTLRTGATCAVIAAGALSLVSGVAVMPVAQLVLVLGAGLVVAASRPAQAPTAAASVREPARLTAATLIAVVAVSAATVLAVEIGADPVGTQLASQDRYLALVDDPVLHPRFWQQGRRGPLVGES